MRSAVGCSRDDQPMPMHGDGLGDIVADLRDPLLAAPPAYRRPEIGSVDAVGGRLAVARKPHRAGSGVKPDRPAGVGSELNRNWKRWLRAILRMHVVWAELCDRPGDAREKHCSAGELNHHFIPDLCAYVQGGVEEFQRVTSTSFPLFWAPSRVPTVALCYFENPGARSSAQGSPGPASDWTFMCRLFKTVAPMSIRHHRLLRARRERRTRFSGGPKRS